MTTSQAAELKILMSKEFSSVFELCIFIFENSGSVKHTLLLEAMKLYSGFIKWFPLEFVFREDLLSKFLSDMKTMNFLRLNTMKCFAEICKILITLSWITDRYK